MDNIKKQNKYRVIGLIALTIIVIIVIVGVVYFVSKKSKDDSIQIQIGQTEAIDGCEFKVNSALEEESTSILKISVEIKNNKDVVESINSNDFKLSGYTLINAEEIDCSIAAGELKEFELLFNIENNSKVLFLEYKNIKVALGDSFYKYEE